MGAQNVETIKMVENAMHVLELLRTAKEPIGVNAIAKTCALTPSTTYRILKTLEMTGWVYQFNDDDRYIAGEKISFVGETSLYYSDDDMLDVISTDHRAERLQQVLNDMPERMRLILRGRLGLDGEERTLEDLGRQFGLTRERIRQIEKNGIRKLEYAGRAYCAQQTKKKKQEKTRGRPPKRSK